MHDHLLDSGALQNLNRVLGSTGGGQHVHIDSSNLQLALNANEFVRRSRTVGLSSGIFNAKYDNVHAGSDSVATLSDPYNLTGGTQAGYPRPVPDGFDVWMLGLTGVATAAAMVSSAAACWAFISYPTTAIAIGSAAGAYTRPVAYFDAQTTMSAGNRFLIAGTDFSTIFGPPRPIRLPRGAQIGWNTTALAVAGTLRLNVVLGLFPAGLGQDGEG